MPNRSTDELFQLIKSMEKSEKRNFKLFMKRISGSEDLKIVTLFDALDKMEDYDEELLLRKNKDIKKQQLSNMKAHLYKQVLSSLRLLRPDESVEMWLNEQMAYARLLYNKGLYMQSLKLLDKIKVVATDNQQMTFLLQVVIFEKKIESLHITRSTENRAEQLSKETLDINYHLGLQGRLSNLSLELYNWYIKLGAARDEKEAAAVRLFFESNLPKELQYSDLNFYERMYMYQSYCWYTFILQDYLGFFKYAFKWVELFDTNPTMRRQETLQYIKGCHNLLTALFQNNSYKKFASTLEKFEAFAVEEDVFFSKNLKIQVFVYLNLARINKYFLNGDFAEGLRYVPEIMSQIEDYRNYLDKHRILVFYYKIACLYFGSGDNNAAIDYLNLIINEKYDLRNDLQCYARLLHLIAHYELGNDDILESLMKSTYRFMAKMQTLTVVEESIFKFLRQSFSVHDDKKLVRAFAALKEKLEKYVNNPFESRSYAYLDILAWLESRIDKIPIAEVRKRRMLNQLLNS